VNTVPIQTRDLPAGLRFAASRASVALFVSPLTDARPVTKWLARHEVPFETVELSMANGLSRDEFHRLQGATGWTGLPQIFIDGQFVGGIEEFFDHPMVQGHAEAAAPADVRSPARWLGYLGAIPFAATAVGALMFSAARDFMLELLAGYGAVILSFVGALHWARALSGSSRHVGAWLLGVSVMPALAAWVSLALPRPGGLLLLSVAFVTLYWFDHEAWHDQPWFLRLRLHLSAVAVLSLVTGAALGGLAG
jgi:glutaredoxin